MTPREMGRDWADRRRDHLTADLVDVGLVFVKVFGWDHGLAYFECTVVAPRVYRRVLLGPQRRPRRGGDAGKLIPAE